jgi:hypothetical protein
LRLEKSVLRSLRPILLCLLPLLIAVAYPWCAAAQEAQAPAEPKAEAKAEQQVSAPAPEQAAAPDKRAYGILPNYRTVEGTDVEPLTVRHKFWIAAKDSFDYPIYFISGAFAGISQIENTNPSFGQGVKGYALRYASGYGDQMIGNMMTEGVFPSLLHEDMRYFRKGAGRKWGRTYYALTRVLVTHTDAGGLRFNYSEVVGNSVATAISNLYNPDTRDAMENLEKLGLQVGTDAISNVLKEFWPDVKHWLHRKDSTVTP